MGYAMAAAAADMGAETILISGPVSLPVPAGVTRISVESAADMFEAVKTQFEDADFVIKTAAVADYRPKTAAGEKMKKQDGESSILLERTVDILNYLGMHKKDQILIGFAAETNNVSQYAKEKLKKKNADFIIANDVTEAQAGFESDTNKVTIYGNHDFEQTFDLMPKQELAYRLLQLVIEQEEKHDR
jgi:phosphopantothenoylcysteine decarboxylase / phosphopantothenate---cysteine ligase